MVYNYFANKFKDFFNNSNIYCTKLHDSSIIKVNCTSWLINNDEQCMQTAEFSSPALTYELEHSIIMNAPGKIIFTISVDSKRISDTISYGELQFSNNNELITSKSFIRGKENVEFPLKAGLNHISLLYSLQSPEQGQGLKAYIYNITIVNYTANGPFQCASCPPNQFSDPSSSSCHICAKGYYIDTDSTCKQCEDNTVSDENSIGKNSCRPKKPCEITDYILTSGECINSKILVSYIIKPGTICDLAKSNYTHKTIDCYPCEEGEKKEKDLCIACSSGTSSSIENSEQCIPCKAGTFSQNKISIDFSRHYSYYSNKYNFTFEGNWNVENNYLSSVTVLLVFQRKLKNNLQFRSNTRRCVHQNFIRLQPRSTPPDRSK